MLFGFALPNSLDVDGLCRFARAADELGFDSLWAGDHIVLPEAPTNQYPYTTDGSFRPGNTPFLEVVTLLSYVAAHTKRIRIGTTVLIVPYRHPLLQAKMMATLDVLTGGRAICGVGVGWLEKEFDALGVSYADRGALTDESLQIFKTAWSDEPLTFKGQFFNIDGVLAYPKPVQKPCIPIWVGGHSKRAIQRTVAYGDAWHPTRQTPEYVEGLLPYLRERTEALGRDFSEIAISLKRSLHFTDLGILDASTVQSNGAVVGTTQAVIEDVLRCWDMGIHQLTYDFRTADFDHCVRMLEHFAEAVVPKVESRA
ncbi:MAG: Flavin-dependent oxidoreductase, luciferase family [Chloroflexi bacterium]|jgi:probable F420-dependent oxidoreductase|nr:MAG: Flavin-dependent oxidoreductase, luciferase family [Chloroflexota bacterium]